MMRPLRPFVPVILLAQLVSVLAMVMSAAADRRTVTALLAASFAAMMVGIALSLNVPALRTVGGLSEQEARILHRRNATLTACVYAWGSAAMFAIYTLSGLTWRHGWQYGLGMALIGAGLMAYAVNLDRTTNAKQAPPLLTVLHAVAAGSGLVYLLAAGKLQTLKRDWAANDVFLFGGLAILVISMIAALSERASRKAGASPATNGTASA